MSAMRRAMSVAHGADALVALSLSDPFCVERHQSEFLDLLHGDVDVLFANEDEITLLFGAASFDAAVSSVEETGLLAALTRGAAGSVVVTASGPVSVPADPVERVVDTTGAGDLYAAGFLHGLTHGLDPERCARLGALCAAEVISHIGARPQADLRQLATAAGPAVMPPFARTPRRRCSASCVALRGGLDGEVGQIEVAEAHQHRRHPAAQRPHRPRQSGGVVHGALVESEGALVGGLHREARAFAAGS